MKKLFLVALAAVGLASCVQTEELAVANNKEAIAFDTFVENVTKTLYDNSNLTYFNVYGTITADNGGLITNIFPGVPVTNETGPWTYDSQFTQYWIPGFTYKFAAVVGAKEDKAVVGLDTNGMPATISTNLQDQEDILYKEVEKHFGTNDTAAKVSFQFAHLLSKAKFTVKNTISANPKLVYNIESVTITNADATAAYDVATGVWSASGTYPANYGVAGPIVKGDEIVGNDVLLVPGTKELEIAIKYTLTYNKAADNVATLIDETKKLTAVLTLEQGKAYNFVVEFGNPGEEIEFEAIVRDWTNGSVEVFQGVSVPVTNAQELVDAIKNPEVGEAVLMNDIDLTSTITRSGEESTPVIAKSFVIDGNDKTLTYSGSNRVIDITYNEGNNDNLVVTIKDLTINCSASYCQRGINYNAGGLLIIDNVKFEGTAPTYAVNCPASSDNAVVKIKNSVVKGNIALNVWGSDMKVDVTNSHLISVDNNKVENYSAITLNNDGTYVAEGTVVNIEGGSVIARDEKGDPSYAVRNSTATGCVNISDTTTVVGEIKIPVVIVAYEGYSEFYSFTTVQEAIDKVQADKNGIVRLIKDLVLTEPIEVKACDYNVVLDLNGHTISQEKACTASYEMIANNGELTIMGNGKISFKDTGAGDPTFGWGSYTICNRGTLVVEDGVIIEHLGNQDFATHMICAIFQYSGSTTINGGVISTPNYRSARLWKGSMTINGGEFNGQLWVQAVDNSAELTVNGGSFAPVGGDGSSIFVTNDQYTVNLAVNGGYFNTKIGTSVPSKEGVKGAIKGGIFTESAKTNTNAALLAEGYSFVEENGVWTVALTPIVVKNAVELNKSISDVKDGGLIIITDDFNFTKEEGGYYNNGGWRDGLGYSGDKSFTIDLNGKTVGNAKDALNDYLFWFKNDGEKPNTITIKNGTLDAGTTAYCALATASSNKQTITINLENVNLINNNTSGAVAKIRAGAVLNVKAGTNITGKNSYTGIECVGSTTNIYEGAEIYQKGTSSSWGFLAGASWGGVINVYGGKGVSARGGFMAMTSGGTVNVHGGEWIANTDGTVGDNSNLYVLTAQNNKYESGWCAPSIINVTGGTLRGGMDAWVLNDPTKEKAELNISGGNFNANPTSYLKDATATENNGIWTVTK